MISGFPEKGWDFEAVQWVPLFRGPYPEGKRLIQRLDEANIPNKFSPVRAEAGTTEIVVEVMRRWRTQAEKMLESLRADTEASGDA